MVRLKRTIRVDGKDHVSFIVLDDSEWRVLQANIDSLGGVKLEVVNSAGIPEVQEQVEPDDKPTLYAYEELRIEGEKLFKEGKWHDALYHYEKAAAIKDSIFIKGRINKCRDELNPKKDDKSNKRKPGRKPYKRK